MRDYVSCLSEQTCGARFVASATHTGRAFYSLSHYYFFIDRVLPATAPLIICARTGVGATSAGTYATSQRWKLSASRRVGAVPGAWLASRSLCFIVISVLCLNDPFCT